MAVWLYPLLVFVLVVSVARPHWGLAILVGLLPVEGILPRGTVTMIGGVALVGAAGRLLGAGGLHLRPNRALLAGVAFIAWIAMTHPAEAWSGISGRNWIFTFAQLWAVAFLASATLDSREKHVQVLTCFAAACAVSAVFAIAAGDIYAARTGRSAGLVVGENTAGRYFAYGMVILLFSAWMAKNRILRVVMIAGAILLMLGIIYTGSRTGLALGLAAIALVPLMGQHRKTGRVILTVGIFVLAAAILLPSGTTDTIRSWFQLRPEVGEGQFEGLEGNIRFYVWQAAFELWRDNPIVGLGLDGFVRSAPNYIHLNLREHVFETLTPHNTYMTLLCETGAVGLLLFLSMIWSSGVGIWRAYKADSSPGPPAIWLLTLALIVAGCTLKNDFAEKMLWITIGAGISLTPVVEPSAERQRALSGPARLMKRLQTRTTVSAWRPSVVERPKAADSRRTH
jgi:O-antigen ligase